MNERLTLPAHRVITPVTAFLTGVALVAALALGFGLRAWTEDGSGASTSAVTPTHQISNARDEASSRTAAASRRAEAASDATIPLAVTRGHR